MVWLSVLVGEGDDDIREIDRELVGPVDESECDG